MAFLYSSLAMRVWRHRYKLMFQLCCRPQARAVARAAMPGPAAMAVRVAQVARAVRVVTAAVEDLPAQAAMVETEVAVVQVEKVARVARVDPGERAVRAAREAMRPSAVAFTAARDFFPVQG